MSLYLLPIGAKKQMETINTLLIELRDNKCSQEIKELVIETLILDIVAALDVLDPTDDGDEIVNALLVEGKESLLKILLGVDDLEEYTEVLLRDLQEKDEWIHGPRRLASAA